MAEPYIRDLFMRGPLTKFDPALKRIVDFARFVAIYTFNLDNNEWEKAEFEGPLFVYMREGEPSSSVVVLNGLGVENFLEPLTRTTILQINDPFLLFVNSKFNLYGIWFCDSEDCDRISHVMQGIIGNMGGSHNGLNTDPIVRDENILRMIEEVEEAYKNSKKARADAGPLKKRQRMNEDTDENGGKTRQSVMNPVAGAGTASTNRQMGPTDGDDNERAATNPQTRRIILNPHNSVDQIEMKRMVSVRGKEPNGQGLSDDRARAGEGTSKRPDTPDPTKSAKEFIARLEKCVKLHPPVGVDQDAFPLMDNESPPVSPPCFPPLIPPMMPLPRGIFGDKVLPLNQNGNGNENGSPPHSPNPNPEGNGNGNGNEGHNFDFVNSASSFNRVFSVSREELKHAVTRKIAPPRPETLHFSTNPLTVTQLLQAFLYLLRTDPAFMNRIHEAYLKFASERRS